MGDAGQAVHYRPAKDFRQGAWSQLLHWLAGLRCPWKARPSRQLRLCETLSLGERRFLSLVELGQQRFLLGATGNFLSVLAVLGDAPPSTSTPALPERKPIWEFVDVSQAQTEMPIRQRSL